MAVIKHISSIKASPLALLKYVVGETKDKKAELVKGLNCSEDPYSAYLEMALCLLAGLDGIEKQMELSPELKRSIRKLNKKEKEEMGIDSLPENLNDALNEFHADELVKEVLGTDFTKYYLKAKKEEWLEYMEQVSEWELEQYLYRV